MKDLVIALAASAQAIQLVQHIAWKNQFEQEQALPLLNSLFQIDAQDTRDIYQGSAQLAPGLRYLSQQLASSKKEANIEFGRYLASLINIEKQFSNRTDMQQQLSERLAHISKLLEFEPISSSAVYVALADTYTQTLSKLPIRVQVYGTPTYLQVESNQHKIRALLLAAVRAQVLWKQLGGKKRHFLFKRKQMLDTAKQLLLTPVYTRYH